MHWKAEEAPEAEAEFEMERRGGRGFPLQSAFFISWIIIGLHTYKIMVGLGSGPLNCTVYVSIGCNLQQVAAV